jgi:hypothetical protein
MTLHLIHDAHEWIVLPFGAMLPVMQREHQNDSSFN